MMNVMNFQEQWRSQMNGILTDMFAPMTSMNGRIGPNDMGRAYPAQMSNTLIDSPPSLHTLSLNSQGNFQPSYYPHHQWDYNRRCMYLFYPLVLFWMFD